MTKQRLKITVLPGDGIGPEVIAATRPFIDWAAREGGYALDICEDDIGGAAYERYGLPLADETLDRCRTSDFVLMGSVGGPQWDSVSYELRPEAGLLKLRKELDLYANLRPALVFDALVGTSSLKPDIVRGLDILIVRELTGGVYFGEPRGIENLKDGQRRGFNTQSYTTREIRRIGEVAFEMAGQRQRRVASADKANVMESGMLWREEITALQAEKYPEITLSHIYADNCAMQLLRDPAQFDVIVTDNLFGDILSDEAAMITGSLGMLPSASLGPASGPAGRRLALYEPVHGSAPDIAGQGKANPLAAILSFSMALKYSMEKKELALKIEHAVADTLAAGLRTADILPNDKNAASLTCVSTREMGDEVYRRLNASSLTLRPFITT